MSVRILFSRATAGDGAHSRTFRSVAAACDGDDVSALRERGNERSPWS